MPYIVVVVVDHGVVINVEAIVMADQALVVSLEENQSQKGQRYLMQNAHVVVLCFTNLADVQHWIKNV
jgi:hypothetical protein